MGKDSQILVGASAETVAKLVTPMLEIIGVELLLYFFGPYIELVYYIHSIQK